MRIVCISASQVPSSTANSIQVMKACQALAQLGHEVRLWVPSPETIPPPSRGEGSGVGRNVQDARGRGEKGADLEWERLASFYGLQTRFEVERIPARSQFRRYDFSLKAVLGAKALKADLLYVWPLQAAVFGLALHMRVALELHGPPEGKLGPVIFWLLRRIPGKRRLLPITQALAALLLRLDGKPYRDGEVVIAHNGVDLERYHDLPEPATARARLGLPGGLTAGYTGHLYAGRGMGLLVELARRFPQVQFLWVGGRESDVEAWKGRLEQEQITNVILAGFVENQRLPLYQAAADILLMPYERVITGSSGGNSAEYCSPMKMFEYMACGRAVISSDLPVIREVMSEPYCILCPPEDVESWVRALEELIENPEKRLQLGLQARQEALAHTWLQRAQTALAGFL